MQPIVFQQNQREEVRVMGNNIAGAIKAQEGMHNQNFIMQESKPIIYDTTQVTSVANGSNPQPGDPCHPLVKNGHVPLLIKPIPAPTITKYNMDSRSPQSSEQQAVIHAVLNAQITANQNCENGDGNDRIADTLTKGANQTTEFVGDIALHNNVLIRRLTPKECGRLQGFPDGYLECVPGYSDSKAYAAFGNSMTTYVMQWIGSRIQLVDSAIKELAAQRTEP